MSYDYILTVNLVSANSLFNADKDEKNGTSDPFVVFSLGNQTFSSQVMLNKLNCDFNETFNLQWDGTTPLKAEVWDYDNGKTDTTNDPMGNNKTYIFLSAILLLMDL